MTINSQGRNVQDELNRSMPASQDAKLGDQLAAMIAGYNQLRTDHNAMVTKYNALLAHIDVGNVAGIGNTNVTGFGAATTAAAAPLLGTL